MKLTRDPLFRFFILGGLLLLVYAVSEGFFTGAAQRTIEIGAPEVAVLADNFERQWRRPPTEEELRGLVEARVREEVLYREALRLGLDTDDVVVRRRMVQKMELLTQDIALMADPTDEELRRFFADNGEDYRLPDRLSFEQIYFSVDRRGNAAEDDATEVMARITTGEEPADPAALGDPSMLPSVFRAAVRPDVERTFGSQFAAQLYDLEEGWHGPLRSPFGVHLVHIVGHEEGGVPGYEALRADLVRDFNVQRADAAKERLYQGLLAEYNVSIDDEAIRGAALETAR